MRRSLLLLLSASALALALGAQAALAAGPTLRGDVTARRDTLTLGDLVADAPPALADTPLFRAPALGQTGTIQARRILSALETVGLPVVDTGGRIQVTVTRAARHLGPVEIEGALKKSLAAQAGYDPVATGVTFDGNPPLLLLAPDTPGEVEVSDLVVDRRAKRVAATIWVGPSAAERRGSVRVVGSIVDLVEVPVVARALDRGETVRPGDVATEMRPRDSVPSDALSDSTPLEGRVAKRALTAGAALRTGDLIRPDLVGKGDVVTAVYEAGGMSLSLRMTASGPGARGDTITVVNPNSKKAVQATVVGPGRVLVGPTPAPSPRLASAARP